MPKKTDEQPEPARYIVRVGALGPTGHGGPWQRDETFTEDDFGPDMGHHLRRLLERGDIELLDSADLPADATAAE